MKHLVIPDLQIKYGVPTDHLTWIGKFIVDHKPEVIVQIGDFLDMESLSEYDKGKKAFEGRRIIRDLKAGEDAMKKLMQPLNDYNEIRIRGKRSQYKPRLVLTLGNHEERIKRVCENTSALDGFLTYDSLGYKKWGWEVHDYLETVEIDGVWYSHYFVNPASLVKSALGGTINNKLDKIANSFTMGHQQHLQYGLKHLPNGRTLHGLVAGACYLHDEDYLGNQGKNYWRGVIMKHRVKNGEYDPMFVSLGYLQEKYNESSK